ncbi:unnamed protein product, partial [Ectocarpus fasciculatus]
GPASAGGAPGSSGSGGDIAPARWPGGEAPPARFLTMGEPPVQAAGGGGRGTATRADVSGRNPFATSGNPFAVSPAAAEGQGRAGRWVDGDGAAGGEEGRGAR